MNIKLSEMSVCFYTQSTREYRYVQMRMAYVIRQHKFIKKIENLNIYGNNNVYETCTSRPSTTTTFFFPTHIYRVTYKLF
jgi:hypothetical protein